MDPLAVLLVLLAVALTVAVISWPLRAGRDERDEAAQEAQLADLEAAKEARYREIREAEMDFRTGKLSEADWRTIDRQLRAEAVELLRRLDALGAAERAAAADEPLPSGEQCSEPSSPSSRSRSASS
jgi:type II secretory pathway pseudopilin PulG